MDEFTQAYITAALWSSTDDEGEPLDKKYSESDLAPATLETMERYAGTFQTENADLLSKVYRRQKKYTAASAGHDLWLTSAHHGSGYWDGRIENEEIAKKLTDAAHNLGELELYVGDDGKIYASGHENQANEASAPSAIAQDFNTSEDALHHAAHNGFSHFTKIGRRVMVYGPTAEGRTLSARMYRHKGKVHFTEPVISKKAMPKRAKPIEHTHHEHEHGAPPPDHKIIRTGSYRGVSYKLFRDYEDKDGTVSLLIEGGPHNGGQGWHKDGFKTIEEAVAAAHATIDAHPDAYGATDDANTIPTPNHVEAPARGRLNPEGLTFAEWLAAANFGRRGHYKDDAHMRREWASGVDPTEYAAHQGISRAAEGGHAPPKIIEGGDHEPMARASVWRLGPGGGEVPVHVRRVGGAQAEMAERELGLIKVDKASAKRLWDAGVPLTLVGSNVNSFHFFGGWHLAYSVDPSDEKYKGQFDVVVNSFNAHLEPELGRRVSFFVDKKYMTGDVDSKRPSAGAPEGETITYTNAPEEYDWFGTKTIEVAGQDSRGKIVRKVSGPTGRVEDQRDRYASGNHMAVDQVEWDKLVRYKLVTVPHPDWEPGGVSAPARAPVARERGLVWLQRPDGVYWANATGGTFWLMPTPSGDYRAVWTAKGGDQQDLGEFPYATAVQMAGRFDPVTGQHEQPEYRQAPRHEHRQVAAKHGKHAPHQYSVTYRSEAGDRHGMTLVQAKAILAPLGIVLSKKDEEYRVNFRGGNEASAYYTNDIEDAVYSGKSMARGRGQPRRFMEPNAPGRHRGEGGPHKILTTFSRMTPAGEDEYPDEEHGWIDEEGSDMEPDADETAVDKAVKFLKNEGATEGSGSHFSPGNWYSTEYQTLDYGTGEEEQRSFHLYGFTDDEERAIWDAMGVGWDSPKRRASAPKRKHARVMTMMEKIRWRVANRDVHWQARTRFIDGDIYKYSDGSYEAVTSDGIHADKADFKRLDDAKRHVEHLNDLAAKNKESGGHGTFRSGMNEPNAAE